MRKQFLLIILALLLAACTASVENELASVEEGIDEPNTAIVEANTETETAVTESEPESVAEVVEEAVEETAVEETAVEETVIEMTLAEKNDALIDAARDDDLALAQQMIEAEADLNIAERAVGFTPIMIATIRGNTDMFNLLLDAGADVTVTDKQNNNLLHHAVSGNHIEIASILVTLDSVDIDHARKQWGFSPLLLAAYEGKVEMVELLVANGANIEALDDWEDTALNGAAYAGQLEAVQTLVELGANPNAINVSGNGALDHATSQNHEDVQAYLQTVITDE